MEGGGLRAIGRQMPSGEGIVASELLSLGQRKGQETLVVAGAHQHQHP